MQTQQELREHPIRSVCATDPVGSPFREILVNDDLREELLRRFFETQHVQGFRDWQWEYVNRPFTQQTGAVLQMPPGAGKTLVAQWIIIESLLIFPKKRVIFAVPLRVLAKQVRDDVQRVLDMLNSFIRDLPPDITSDGRPLRDYLPRQPGRRDTDADTEGFTVGLAEGPGARVDLQYINVLVATYEHAAGELRKDPNAKPQQQGAPKIHVGLVIVDEVHNIAKGDARSVVIDDIFFFTNARFVYSNTSGRVREEVPILDQNGEQLRGPDGRPLTEVREFTYKLPRVIGMSGTLEDWTSKRLLEAYPRPHPTHPVPALFHQILTTEGLTAQTQTETRPTQPRRGPARVMLDKNRFSVQATVCFAADIVRGLLEERRRNAGNPSYRPRRLVVFMSTVAEAEMAYIHLLADKAIAQAAKEAAAAAAAGEAEGGFVAPRITLVNTIGQLSEKFEKDSQGFSFAASNIFEALSPQIPRMDPKSAADPVIGSTATTEAVRLLESAGIYIHHAQIAQPEVPPQPGEQPQAPQRWSDVVQEQLVKDFVAVFSTSTISVGVNLASTMLGILGPNTMWTVDQAEQMIGRVGRVNEDAANSAVAVVDSAYYHLPPPVSMTLPNEWFVPRLTALLMFSTGWAQRMAAPAQENANRMIRDALEEQEQQQEKQEAEQQGLVQLIERVQGDSTIKVTAWKNADVRGFFSPSGAADINLTDEPGNGVADIAINWGLISGNPEAEDFGMVTPECTAALELCKQDMKSLPATMHLLLSQFPQAPQTPQTREEMLEDQAESWKVVLLWAMLMTRLPAMWYKWMEETKGEGTSQLNKIRITLNQTPNQSGGLLFWTASSNKAALDMIGYYGEAHQQYEGQQDVPGATNAPRVVAFAELFVWALGLFNRSWPTKRPVDMYNYAIDVMQFIDATIADATALTTVTAHLGLNYALLSGALRRARDFFYTALFPYSTARPDLAALRELNRNPALKLSIATPAFVTFLLRPGDVPMQLAHEGLIQQYRISLLAAYRAIGVEGPAVLALSAHIEGYIRSSDGEREYSVPQPLPPPQEPQQPTRNVFSRSGSRLSLGFSSNSGGFSSGRR